MHYIVYVLESEKDGSKYIGFTHNSGVRLREHNQGRNISTCSKGPWSVIYTEELPNRVLAEKREKFFKSGHGKEVLKNLLSHRNIGA